MIEPISTVQSALLVVDAQRGFTSLCPQELPIPGGLEIVPRINQFLGFHWKRIDASLDWHPPDHCSFFGQRDNLYPPHCIAGTTGSRFLPGLDTRRFHTIWRKGFYSEFEAYAVTAQHPGFAAVLQASGVDTVLVCGLATNICCHFTARDLRQAGFRVLIIEDASAGLDVPAASLYQLASKEEGKRLGIEYVATREALELIR